MDSTNNYNELLLAYKILENRVAHFSSIEQALINARDTLDHEFILYERLNKFVSVALNLPLDNNFYQLVCEAIVDIFEVESSLLFIRNNDTGNIIIYSEGLRNRINEDELVAVYSGWVNSYSIDQVNILDTIIETKQDSIVRGVISNFHNKEINSLICASGLVFEKMNGNYPQISLNRQTIFGVFINYLNTIITNRANQLKIEEHLTQISKSKIELEKLSLIATKTGSGVIISDPEGKIEWINDAFLKISGYNLEEIKGKKPKEFLHGPETDMMVSEKIGDALRKMLPVEETVINYSKSGRKYYTQLQVNPIFNEDGALLNFIALQKDITNERNYQKLILKSNSKFEVITSKSQIGIWEWDVVSNNTTWNSILLDQYGSEIIKINNFYDFWKNAIHPDDYEYVLSLSNELLNSSKDLIENEYRIIRNDTSVISHLKCVTVAERDSKGNLLRLIGSSIDITERKNAEAEREGYLQSINGLKQFYEGVISHLPSTIVVLDDELSEIYSNKNGYVDEEIIDKSREAKLNNTLISFEQNLNNEEYNLVSILPQVGQGVSKNTIIVSTDITNLKKFEIDLLNKNNELKKTNSELDSFVYSVSHDLRAPLLSLKGILELIVESDGLSEEVCDLLDMGKLSVLRLDNTIQEILEYSRNSRLDINLEKFDALEVAQDIFDGIKYSTEKPVEFVMEIIGDKYIYTDRSRLKVVLANLISNAVKYRKRDIENPFVKFSLALHNYGYEIKIEDNSEGISELNQSKVFDMFYRASNSDVGTGLGLYICREIITKLNGEIKLTSNLGTGSIFTVLLPNIAPDKTLESL
jgi:PAS domain S-box-containing protein